MPMAPDADVPNRPTKAASAMLYRFAISMLMTEGMPSVTTRCPTGDSVIFR